MYLDRGDKTTNVVCCCASISPLRAPNLSLYSDLPQRHVLPPLSHSDNLTQGSPCVRVEFRPAFEFLSFKLLLGVQWLCGFV
jgi:hypothetical protein